MIASAHGSPGLVTGHPRLRGGRGGMWLATPMVLEMANTCYVGCDASPPGITHHVPVVPHVPLALTGFSADWLVVLAVGLIVLGAALSTWNRLRRS